MQPQAGEGRERGEGGNRLFARLANGELWESRDRGDSWTAAQLDGDTLAAVLAPDRVIGA